MSKLVDLTGKRFGRWSVLDRAPNTAFGQVQWTVLCDCGRKRVVPSVCLKDGRSRSCGCLRADGLTKYSKEDAAIVSLMGYYRNRHPRLKNRVEHQFRLGFEEFKALVKSDCFYCGAPPSNRMNHAVGTNRGYMLVYSGVDRKDSSQGYVPGNCVPCCIRCNQAKSDLSLDEFEAWLHQAYWHFCVGKQLEEK